MDDEFDYSEDGGEEADNEFIEFVTGLAANNRNRLIRDTIERLEESRKLREQLGLDGFELSPHY